MATEIHPKAKRAATIFLLAAGAVLWIPTARLLMGRPPAFLRDLGYLSGPPGTPLAWVLACLVALLYTAFAVGNIPLVRQHCCRLSAAKLLGVVAAVAAAIVEEAFFRRLVMDWVQSAEGGRLLQIAASGLIFGLAHGSWGIVTGRIAAGVGAMIATGSLGFALGAVYLIGERSLAPVIASHFVVTATIQPGMMYAAFSGQLHRPKSV